MHVLVDLGLYDSKKNTNILHTTDKGVHTTLLKPEKLT